jgi:hypothetical protein
MSLDISWTKDVPVVEAPGRPGSYCPGRFSGEWSDGSFELKIEVTDGEAVVAGVFTTDFPVPRDLVRDRVSAAVDGACWAVEQLTPQQLSERGPQRIEVKGKPRRPKLSDEHLKQVARIHERSQTKPTASVAGAMALTQDNAAQRVALARRRGFLLQASDDERVGASARPA